MKFLPTAQEVVGLDIGHRYIKALVLKKGKGGIEITSAALARIESLPEDKKEERLARTFEALQAVLTQLGRRSGRVALACSGESVFSRIVRLPPVTKGKLKQIVQYEAQQQIPFSLSEVIWDYHLLNTRTKTELSALILAVKKEVAEEILGVVAPLKLEVEILDFTSLCLYNTLKFNGGLTDPRGRAIVDLGANSTDIVIVENGTIAMVRPIPLGGDNISQAIGRALAIDFQEAEKLKDKEAFIPVAGREAASEQERKIFAAVQPILEEILDEIRRSIGYYRSQLRGGAIEGLVLSGGGLNLKNMGKYIEENLRIKVEKINPFTRVHLPTEILSSFPEPSIFSVAMGLGLRGLAEGDIRINLLPEPILQRLEFRKKEPILVLSFVLVLLSLLVCAGIMRERASRQEAVLKAVNETLADYTSRENSLKPRREERQKLFKLISQFEGISRQRSFWLDVLAEVVNLVPDRITLESFSTVVKEERKEGEAPLSKVSPELAGRLSQKGRERPKPEAAATGEVIKLKGLSPDFPTIQDFISRLEASPFFSRVEVDPSSGQTVRIGDGEFKDFTLIVKVVK